MSLSCLLSPIFSEHWSESLCWCQRTAGIFLHVHYDQYFQNTGPSHSVGANVQRVFSLMFTMTNIFRTLVPVTLLVPTYSGYFPSCLLSPIFSEHWSQSLCWCQRTAGIFPHVYYDQYFQNTGPSHSVGANAQRVFSLMFTMTNIFRTLVPVTRLVPMYSKYFPSCLLSPIFSEHWSQSLGWCQRTASIFPHVYYDQYFQNTGPSHSVGANVQ